MLWPHYSKAGGSQGLPTDPTNKGNSFPSTGFCIACLQICGTGDTLKPSAPQDDSTQRQWLHCKKWRQGWRNTQVLAKGTSIGPSKPLLVPVYHPTYTTHHLPPSLPPQHSGLSCTLNSFVALIPLLLSVGLSALSCYFRADCKDFGPIKFSCDVTNLVTLYPTPVSIRKKKSS